jgi:hypothetical protein
VILGVLIRAILEFCRRRGMRVPDLSRLRRRKPRLDMTKHVAQRIATLADDLPRWRADHQDDTR